MCQGGDEANRVPTRGDIHVMLVGDPGLGKSQLLQVECGGRGGALLLWGLGSLLLCCLTPCPSAPSRLPVSLTPCPSPFLFPPGCRSSGAPWAVRVRQDQHVRGAHGLGGAVSCLGCAWGLRAEERLALVCDSWQWSAGLTVSVVR